MKLRFGYLISGITTGFILLLSFILAQPDGKLHIVFCNVGQGDAVYIRFPGGSDMLIDGGPDNGRVLTCLGRHMPFFDRHIDVVALSHPQADHMGGLISVLNRYTAGYFVRSNIDTSAENFRKLIDTVNKKNIPVKYLIAGDTITIDNTTLSVLWPSNEQMALTGPPGDLSDILGVSVQLNDFCLVFALRYGVFDVVLPGDADSHVEAKYSQLQVFNDPVEILKVPHHGSKTGMTLAFLDRLKPQAAVISVGKNTYGHPSKEIVDMLQNINSRILRTDESGDIEVVSDGINWEAVLLNTR